MTSAVRRLAKQMDRNEELSTIASSFPTESEELEATDNPAARRASVVLVNLTAILEKLDEQLLPSLYASVASSFSATAQELGWITFGRALVQAVASPVGGMAGVKKLPEV